MSTRVSYALQDGIATITMDDGKVNTMSLAMLTELNAALDQAEADRAVVILTGRTGVFSAGFDLAVLQARGEPGIAMLNAGFKTAARLLAHPYPIVVAANGHSLAMGVFLVLAADFRIGTEGSFKVGANEVAIGLVMPATAVEVCRQRLQPSYFNRAVMNAEIFGPAEALTAGFFDRLTSAENLQAEALKAAQQLTKLNMHAHTATKRLVRAQLFKDVEAALAADDATFRKMMAL